MKTSNKRELVVGRWLGYTNSSITCSANQTERIQYGTTPLGKQPFNFLFVTFNKGLKMSNAKRPQKMAKQMLMFNLKLPIMPVFSF